MTSSVDTGARAPRTINRRGPPALRVQGMSKTYTAVRALVDVRLSVWPGEVVGLVGDNGAGKSTLVKCVVGRSHPDSGSVFVGGEQLHVRSPEAARAAGIEAVYQNLALVDSLDIAANLFLGRELTHGQGWWGRSGLLSRRRMRAEAARVLHEFGVDLGRASLSDTVDRLSGGQRQGIAVARAIVWGQKVVLLDEPAAALGVEQTENVLNLVRRLRDQGGRCDLHQPQHGSGDEGLRPRRRDAPRSHAGLGRDRRGDHHRSRRLHHRRAAPAVRRGGLLMFLDVLQRRNPAFLKAVVELHQQGELPAGTFAIDLAAVRGNAESIAAEGQRLGVSVFAMTKQFGRNPDVCTAVREGGIESSVAVDLACAAATHAAGMHVGHLGHLVQIPVHETATAAALEPAYWTVFNDDKARAAAAAAAELGREQPLLARIHADRDTFYPGHEGGFAADDALAVADRLDRLTGGRFAGITTFPALLFDPDSRTVAPTPNLRTLEATAATLRAVGHEIEINGPGTTSTVTLSALASAGVTQVEPGHALTGTTPLHAFEDLPELPAMCFVTEVSHSYGGRAYCFGGGLYIDPVFPPYQVRAYVTSGAEADRLVDAEIPDPSSIDYYGQLDADDLAVGTTVIFGFRAQAFVTRALTAGVGGVGSGRPTVAGLYRVDGSPLTTAS